MEERGGGAVRLRGTDGEKGRRMRMARGKAGCSGEQIDYQRAGEQERGGSHVSVRAAARSSMSISSSVTGGSLLRSAAE